MFEPVVRPDSGRPDPTGQVTPPASSGVDLRPRVAPRHPRRRHRPLLRGARSDSGRPRPSQSRRPASRIRRTRVELQIISFAPTDRKAQRDLLESRTPLLLCARSSGLASRPPRYRSLGTARVGSGHRLAGAGPIAGTELDGERIALTGHRDDAALDAAVTKSLAELEVVAAHAPGVPGPAFARGRREERRDRADDDARPPPDWSARAEARASPSATAWTTGAPTAMRRIGTWLGVGPERSRQIEHDALRRLRSIAATSARAA
jgi:hypothetical protein